MKSTLRRSDSKVIRNVSWVQKFVYFEFSDVFESTMNYRLGPGEILWPSNRPPKLANQTKSKGKIAKNHKNWNIFKMRRLFRKIPQKFFSNMFATCSGVHRKKNAILSTFDFSIFSTFSNFEKFDLPFKCNFFFRENRKKKIWVVFEQLLGSTFMCAKEKTQSFRNMKKLRKVEYVKKSAFN